MTAGNVWLLTSSALVLLMTPGVAFFYGGLVKAKSVISMLMLNFGVIALVGVLWIVYGFNVNVITGTSLWESADGTGDWIPGVFGNPLSDPGLLHTDGVTLINVAFGATFAIITTALISGAIADRAKFGSWMVFAALWATLAYFPIAGWVWSSGGWIYTLGEMLFPGGGVAVIDWAGGTAVHINAGAAALALALVLGKRIGFAKGIQKPHNVPFVLLGAAILWFGWFGFNTGAVGNVTDNADAVAGVVFLNTMAAPAAAIIGWLIVEKYKDGKATAVGAASGAVAGLVAITPACHDLTPGWALLLGLITGALCALAVDLKYTLGYDDSLDVVGIHLVAGMIGTLYLGFFANGTGLLMVGGDWRQLVLQAISAFAVLIYSFVVALVVGLLIEKTIGFRVRNEDELAGIDTVVHGEEAYASVD